MTIAKYYTPSGRCIQKLDYSTKKLGEKADTIDAATISTFKTKNGRTVKDGRGVEPDVIIERKSLSRLTATLMINDLIFNFSTDYRVKNELASSAKAFRLTDAEYTEFTNYVLSQDFDYTTASSEYMTRLKEVAKDEGYYEDSKQDFDELLEFYKPSKERDLMKFKSEITALLEDEIIGRYYFQTGRIQHALLDDSYILEAIKILNDSKRYNQILGTQN